jgi:CBS domain-containing protein
MGQSLSPIENVMLTLRDIMTADVVTLDPEMTLREALEILTARQISGAPVLEGGRIVGVFSAMDAIEFLATTPGVPDIAATQSEGETEDLRVAVDADADAPAAYFVDFWSDAGADVDERFRDVGAAAWDLLAEHTVGEAMSRRVAALTPGASVRAAADIMQRARVHRVLVMDGTKLAGIVSALDIANAVARRRLEPTR